MAKRKAPQANGEAAQKKKKVAAAELPAAVAPVLVPAKAQQEGKVKRLGKAARLRAAALQAAEPPLPEPVEAAARPSERPDATGAAAAVLTPTVNGGAAASEPAFRNKEKVLLLSSRGITHRCASHCQH